MRPCDSFNPTQPSDSADITLCFTRVQMLILATFTTGLRNTASVCPVSHAHMGSGKLSPKHWYRPNNIPEAYGGSRPSYKRNLELFVSELEPINQPNQPTNPNQPNPTNQPTQSIQPTNQPTQTNSTNQPTLREK